MYFRSSGKSGKYVPRKVCAALYLLPLARNECLEYFGDDFRMGRIGQPFAEDIASVTLGAFDRNNESWRHWITYVLSLDRLISFLGAEVIFLQVPALPGRIFEAFP